MNLESLGEDARSILHLDTGDHHAGSSLSPVHRSGHLPPGGQLETVDHSDDLIEVSAGGGGVEQRQLQPLVGADHEHGPARQRQPRRVLLVGVHHAVHLRHVALGVRDDGVGELGEVVVRLDVGDPAVVVLHGVAGERDELDPPGGELLVEGLHPAELGGAHGRVVRGVREQDGPAVPQPRVEVYVAGRGVRGEVWHDFSESRHDSL